MKKCIRIGSLAFFILCVLLLGGCFKKGNQNASSEKVKLYFYDEHKGTLVMEERSIAIEKDFSKEKLMLAILDALSKGPEGSNQGIKPISFNIEQAILKENIAFVNFDKSYNNLDVPTQIIQRAMLVYTLTELDFIDKVEFFVADLPLVNSKGDKIDAVERKDILINALNPKPPTSTQTITLYFPSLADQKLHKELREIRINNNTPIEEYVMAELIKGPTAEGLVRILPGDTKITDIKTQDGVCQIDLSYDLQITHTENLIDKNLIIYAIVNSLTDISRIQKVLFLKEGKKQTEFNIATQSGGVFERDETFILQNP